MLFILHSRLGYQNTPAASLQRGKTPPKGILDSDKSDDPTSVMLEL